ncbi:hypothetical protein Tco_1187213 [Tanacetum coccineum]
MVKKSKLDEDPQGKAVDPTHYRGMVGTLMYLTSSRSDLTFTVCMCAFSDAVMSDSKDSTVTYTEVSSPFADLSDIGSPRVDGPTVMPEDPYAYMVATFQAPPFPDYVSGLEEPDQAPTSPVYILYVPEPVYPEFMPLEDGVLLAEEQPLPAALSPTTDLPGYVPESDPEENSKEDDDKDPEEDPADYPANEEDDGNDEDKSSDDDEDDDVDIEEDEEEEHPALIDFTTVAFPAVNHAPFAEDTKPFKTDESAATLPPHPAYWVTARISIRDEPPTPFWSDTEVTRLFVYLLHHHLLVLLIHLGYPAAMIRLRAEAPSTSHSPLPHIILSHTRADTPPSGTPPSGKPPLLPILLPTSSPPLHLPSADHGVDRPEVCLPPRKRSCAAAARPTGGFRDKMLVDMPGAPAADDTELGRQMTEFATKVRQDTYKIYTRLDDEQTKQQLMVGRLNMLYKDRHAHARTTLLMEREARMSQEAWGRSMDASDLRHSETQMIEFQRQYGPAKGLAQPDAPEEAGSSS